MRKSICILVLSVLPWAAGESSAHDKTDIVVLKNGDHLTCEIKEMSRGKLKVSTDAMGTVSIEWDDIRELHTKFYYRTSTGGGVRYYGSLDLAQGETTLRIIGAKSVAAVEMSRVVEITPLEKDFWARMDGSLSFGFSFTKAADVAQLTFDWVNIYRTERNLYDVRANTILTDTRDANEFTRRFDVTLSYTRLLKGKWTGSTNASVQRNDELNLRRRFLFGVATGIHPIQSNRNILDLSAGVALNSEVATGSSDATQSMEGVFSLSYSLFQYDSPKTDISTNVDYYPSITEEGRYRVDLNIKVRYEVFSDFFLDVTYFYNFDSQPPSGTTAKKDYGIVTGVGWSY